MKLTLPDAASSDDVPYNRGLQQGNPVSSSVFDDIMRDILSPMHDRWSTLGLGFRLPDSGRIVTHTRTADHVYIFARGSDEAEQMLGELLLGMLKHGFDINQTSRQFLVAGSLYGTKPSIVPWIF